MYIFILFYALCVLQIIMVGDLARLITYYARNAKELRLYYLDYESSGGLQPNLMISHDHLPDSTMDHEVLQETKQKISPINIINS